MLRACGEMGLADEACRRAVSLNREDPLAHCERGLVMQALGRTEEALECLRQAMHLAPDDVRIRFLKRAMEGKTPAGAPRGYVRDLFDRMAEDFDRHLSSLDYRLPSTFGRHIARQSKRRGRFAQGVDLGCGTGLIGCRIRPVVDRLTGVDLSPEMIRRAEKTGIYDRLRVADLRAYLRRAPRCFDLVVAGDVLIYLGDLDEVFAGVKSCCRPGALFAFSVEERGKRGYRLRQTARFAHSRCYIRSQIDRFGMKLLRRPAVRIRREKNGWAGGRLYMVTL
ncbi:MAG: methyltransferase domain-containing protein [Desulfobacterales bacterium]